MAAPRRTLLLFPSKRSSQVYFRFALVVALRYLMVLSSDIRRPCTVLLLPIHSKRMDAQCIHERTTRAMENHDPQRGARGIVVTSSKPTCSDYPSSLHKPIQEDRVAPTKVGHFYPEQETMTQLYLTDHWPYSSSLTAFEAAKEHLGAEEAKQAKEQPAQHGS